MIFPSDHCSYATGDWPWFGSQQDLENDQYWSAYFTRVYGAVPTWGYPICTGAFQFLWHQATIDTGIVTQKPVQCNGPIGQPSGGAELSDGSYFVGRAQLEAIGVFAYIYNPNFFGAEIPANNWVEVIHTTFPGDEGAIWYYMGVGSGVWFWTGNTRAFYDHHDAVRDLLGSDCHDRPQNHMDHSDWPTECESDFPAVYAEGMKQGIDSIQFTNHYDCTCGPAGPSSWKNYRLCPTEIIALGDPDGAAKGCSKLLQKGGWEASADCNCREDFDAYGPGGKDTVHYANCGSF